MHDDSELRESLDTVTAERLLDGTGDAPPALADLLAQAAAAGRPTELTGADAALAAFRSAAPSLVPRLAARRRWLVAVASAAFTLASAGVAVAAATGVLPNPLRPPSASSPVASSPNPSGDGPSPAVAPGNGRGSDAPGPSAPPPDAAVAGLCRAYLAQLAAGHGDELRNPRFDALVTLAGGADRVPAFCAERESSPRPTHGRSDDHPTGPPTNPGQHANNPNQSAKV